jgi:hypothetical protein
LNTLHYPHESQPGVDKRKLKKEETVTPPWQFQHRLRKDYNLQEVLNTPHRIITKHRKRKCWKKILFLITLYQIFIQSHSTSIISLNFQL